MSAKACLWESRRLYIGGCIETETERIVGFPMFVRGLIEAGMCQSAWKYIAV